MTGARLLPVLLFLLVGLVSPLGVVDGSSVLQPSVIQRLQRRKSPIRHAGTDAVPVPVAAEASADKEKDAASTVAVRRVIGDLDKYFGSRSRSQLEAFRLAAAAASTGTSAGTEATGAPSSSSTGATGAAAASSAPTGPATAIDFIPEFDTILRDAEARLPGLSHSDAVAALGRICDARSAAVPPHFCETLVRVYEAQSAGPDGDAIFQTPQHTITFAQGVVRQYLTSHTAELAGKVDATVATSVRALFSDVLRAIDDQADGDDPVSKRQAVATQLASQCLALQGEQHNLCVRVETAYRILFSDVDIFFSLDVFSKFIQNLLATLQMGGEPTPLAAAIVSGDSGRAGTAGAASSSSTASSASVSSTAVSPDIAEVDELARRKAELQAENEALQDERKSLLNAEPLNQQRQDLLHDILALEAKHQALARAVGERGTQTRDSQQFRLETRLAEQERMLEALKQKELSLRSALEEHTASLEGMDNMDYEQASRVEAAAVATIDSLRQQLAGVEDAIAQLRGHQRVLESVLEPLTVGDSGVDSKGPPPPPQAQGVTLSAGQTRDLAQAVASVNAAQPSVATLAQDLVVLLRAHGQLVDEMRSLKLQLANKSKELVVLRARHLATVTAAARDAALGDDKNRADLQNLVAQLRGYVDHKVGQVGEVRQQYEWYRRRIDELRVHGTGTDSATRITELETEVGRLRALNDKLLQQAGIASGGSSSSSSTGGTEASEVPESVDMNDEQDGIDAALHELPVEVGGQGESADPKPLPEGSVSASLITSFEFRILTASGNDTKTFSLVFGAQLAHALGVPEARVVVRSVHALSTPPQSPHARVVVAFVPNEDGSLPTAQDLVERLTQQVTSHTGSLFAVGLLTSRIESMQQ